MDETSEDYAVIVCGSLGLCLRGQRGCAPRRREGRHRRITRPMPLGTGDSSVKPGCCAGSAFALSSGCGVSPTREVKTSAPAAASRETNGQDPSSTWL